MSENYAVINGKRIELTDEQVKALGIEVRKNPFTRLKNGAADCYYYINECGDIPFGYESGISINEKKYNNINYFNDAAFAKQVALHQLLYRKLLKFAYDNECEDTAKWDCENRHWCIRYDHCDKVFNATWYDTFQYSGVYFSTMESAERAIEEVVMPFIEDHPDFVW